MTGNAERAASTISAGKAGRFARAHGALVAVLVVALVLRLAYCFIIGPALVRNSAQDIGWLMVNGKIASDPYDQIARNIVLGKGYVDDSGRRNYERPPGYVLFLAGGYWLWGFDLWKVQLAQSVLDTVTCLLVFLLASRVLRDRQASLLAALLYAFFYKIINMVSRPMSETFYVFVLLVFLLLFVVSFSRSAFSFPAGLGLGLVTLTKPVTLLFPVVVVVLYLLRGRRSGLQRAVPFVLAFALTCFYPLLSNYRETGRLFFALGGGKIAYMGTAIDYSKTFRVEEQRLVDEIQRDAPDFPYEAEVDARLGSVAIHRILAAPWAYVERVAYRLFLFWVYPDCSTPLRAAKTSVGLLFSLVMCALAVYGAVVARAAGALLSPLVSLFLYCYGLYSLFYTTTRYASPLFPIVFILAAVGAMTLWRRRPLRADAESRV